MQSPRDFDGTAKAHVRQFSGHSSVADLAARVNNRMADLAQSLLGEHNPSHSTKSQLRYGTKGSMAIEIAGPRAGRWYDHEAGIGGDGLELIRHHKGLPDAEARRWARDWLGDIQHQPAKTATPAPNTMERKTTVAAIIARSESIAASPAETYLRKRGITRTPPPCIRFRRFAAGQHGALVALATDEAGEVLAVQQVYLTDDGQKAPVSVVKRTNKAVDGWSDRAAVRLPGIEPLVLCEGIENALSIWQATGQETWACLGISNIALAILGGWTTTAWKPWQQSSRQTATKVMHGTSRSAAISNTRQNSTMACPSRRSLKRRWAWKGGAGRS